MENIIHPVLARVEWDPPGTKRISVFIVPKFFVNPDGSPGERNDILCEGVEEKHGIHASATCRMALGTRGWLTLRRPSSWQSIMRDSGFEERIWQAKMIGMPLQC